MTLNRRLKLIAVFILIVPLAALLITAASFFVSWSLSLKDSEELSVPRFLHEPLLAALHGDEVLESRFAGILMVLDDKGDTVYMVPQVEEKLNEKSWDSMEEAYKDIMAMLPGLPINITVYHYQGRSGLVVYVEHFFSGRKLFRLNALTILGMYFGLIVLPVLILSISSRPVMRTLIVLESSARDIGKGNMDTPVQIPGKQGKRAHAPKEIQSLVGAFERMRVELKENHENQGRIMMAISHDLKTPLTLIKGYVEALKDGMAKNPEDIAEYADVIYDRTMLLEGRINDLIYFAKLRTSDWQSRFKEFSLGEMLDEVAEVFRNDSFIRKRKFSYVSTLSDKFMILGDRKLLVQVFENLFDNACRYTEENDSIDISAGLAPDMAKIVFEDSGRGIGEQHREHIFDSFYRADSGRNTRGVGIGLTSAKTIIENHGGKIHYEPSRLGGAGFVIMLPITT